MLSKNLALDDIDKKIVEVVQKKPNITHTKIAEYVQRSQPTVGMRIKRLEESGALTYRAGFNLSKIDLFFGIVELQTNDPDRIYDIISNCPYMIQTFRLSGINNFFIIIVSDKIEDLDKIVNYHFRSKPFISNISLQMITDFLKDFVVPLDFEMEECDCLLH